MLRRLGVAPEAAFDNAWRSAAWSGKENRKGAGYWEAYLKLPARKGVGFALMLWTHDDRTWPFGEINLAEGVTGTNEVLTNLHWGTQSDPRHEPQYFPLDLTKAHRYAVSLAPGVIKFYIDGVPRRTLNHSQVPVDLPMHFVMQQGADKQMLALNPSAPLSDSFTFDEVTLFKPLQQPSA